MQEVRGSIPLGSTIFLVHFFLRSDPAYPVVTAGHFGCIYEDYIVSTSISHMKLFSILGLAAVLFYGCSSSTSPNVGSGSLAGKVTVLDSNAAYLLDASGVTISVDNGPSTLSMEDGSWRLDGIPAGTHILSYAKPNFGGIKQWNVLVPGPGIQYGFNGTVAKIASEPLFLDSLTANNGGSNRYILSAYFSSPSRWKPAGLWVNLRLKLKPASDTNLLFYADSGPLDSTHAEYRAPLSGYLAASKDTLYVSIAPLPLTSYRDGETGALVFSSLGKFSRELKVVIP
jgi:hypothetical protein